MNTNKNKVTVVATVNFNSIDQVLYYQDVYNILDSLFFKSICKEHFNFTLKHFNVQNIVFDDEKIVYEGYGEGKDLIERIDYLLKNHRDMYINFKRDLSLSGQFDIAFDIDADKIESFKELNFNNPRLGDSGLVYFSQIKYLV